MMAAMASLLTNVLDPLQADRDGQLETAFNTAGMHL